MSSRELPDGWPQIAQVLGERVRELREERGLTQEELANQACISRNQLQNIEHSRNNTQDHDRSTPGPGNPRLATLEAIARVLEVTIPVLLPEEIGGQR